MAARSEVGAFLRARREALAPDDVGLPPGRRRRTPGLRREEVALLAGVSVSWYTWLEQGRPINASRDVLEAIARALQLDGDQRAHLLALAAPEPPAGVAPGHAPAVLADAAGAASAVPPPDSLTRLVDALAPAPAYVLGPCWEYLAWNEPQRRLFGPIARLAPVERNLLWAIFAVPEARTLLADWEREARHAIAQFRVDTARLAGTAARDDLVRRLLDASPEFAAWWPRHDVAGFRTRLRAYDHPSAGRLTFEYQQFAPVEWPHLRVVVQLPLPGDDSAQRLAATWHDVA